MADSRFYYAPMLADGALCVGTSADTDDLETITIPIGSTLCEYDPTGDASVPRSGVGTSYSIAWDRGGTVRIRCDLGNDSDLAEALMAMVSFAKQGGVVGFAFDTDQVWAVQVEADTLRGDTDFDYPVSFVEAWEGITDPEVGWRCVAQSPLPQMRREIIELDGVAGGNATLDGSFVFALSTQGWNVLVRPKLFFPFLRYLSGDVAVSEPTGGVYVFDCTFEVDVGLEHTPIPVPEPLILWNFETVGEGAGGIGTFVNQGSYATTADNENSPTRDAGDFTEGLASVLLDSADSWGIDLNGDTDLDVDAAGATFIFDFKPSTVSGLGVLFDWGATNPSRFGIYRDGAEPKAYVGHSNVFTFLTTGFSITNNVWANWKLWLVPGGTCTLFIDGVSRGTATLPGPFTVAEFGDLVRWARTAFTSANHAAGRIDNFQWWRGLR